MNKGKPLGNNIRIEIVNSGFTAMLQVDERENRTEKALVLEVGKQVKTIKKGDTILFKAYNIDEIEVDGEKYILIPEEDAKYIWSTSTTTKRSTTTGTENLSTVSSASTSSSQEKTQEPAE